MRKPVEEEGPIMDAAMVLDACPVFGKHPRISEHLTHANYEDGTPRKLATLKVAAYDGKVRISLDDHDLKRSLYTVGDDLIECLDLMEGALGDVKVRWYVWGAHKKGKGK